MYIPRNVLRRIVDHAWSSYPVECCGLLVGRRDQVQVAEAVRNLHAGQRSDRFEIDPVDHVRVWEAARAAGCEVVGCYHSHPDGTARPSPLDRRLARRFGGPFGYLIVAVDEEGGWELFAGTIDEGGRIVESPLEIEVG